jgi:uridylate kinase
MNKKTCIISLGGSLIIPDEIDWKYLKAFKNLILEYVRNDWEFIIITGGGKTARKYQEAAHNIDELLTNEDKDWLGIHSTRLNAHLMRTIFREYAYPRINTNPHDLEDFSYCKEPIFIAAGYRPGCSTDYDATLLAKYLGIHSIVNLSNIDYVYDKDPKEHTDAKPLKAMNWKEFRSLVGSDWSPGMNAPFDPIAAKLGEELGLEVAIMNGKDLENLRDYFEKKEYNGTTITS